MASFDGEEIYNAVMNLGQMSQFPIAAQDIPRAQSLIEDLFTQSTVDLSFSHRPSGAMVRGPTKAGCALSHPLNQNNFGLAPANDRQSYKIHGPGAGEQNIFSTLGSVLNNSIYVFRAERLNVSVSNILPSMELSQDASNLASCLLNLQSMPHRYNEYISLVREILPTVQAVSAIPIDGTRAEISVWNIDPAHNRDDLRIKLHESGTGVD